MADLETLKSQALQLEPDARASLVDFLLESLEVGPATSEDVTRAWLKEIERRRREVANGSVRLSPGDDLLADLDRLG